MDVNAFGQALAAALIERTGAKMVYVPEDQQIVQEDGDRKQVVNLGNFYQMHEGGQSIEDVVALIIRLREQENVEITPEEARTHLHLHVISADYMDDAGVFRSVGPGIKDALVLDYPDFVRFLTKADFEKLGEPEDVLWAIAEVNTDAKMPEPKIAHAPNGDEIQVFDCSMGAVYAWRYATTHGEVLCGVPHREIGFVANPTSEETAKTLVLTAMSFFSEAASHALSPFVYVFRDGEAHSMLGAFHVTDDKSNAS